MKPGMDYSRKKWLHKQDKARSSRSGAKSLGRYALILVLLAGLGSAAYYLVDYWRGQSRWRYIVIHHSAAPAGNLRFIRKQHMHRAVNPWPDIAYHFVVNNGSMNRAPGQIEVSDRWKNQLHGFSTKVSYINHRGIAVVLVGNFETRPVPLIQKEALIKLVSNLAHTHRIPVDKIIGHRDLQSTACPGKHLDLKEIRKRVAENLKHTQTRADGLLK